MKLRPTLLLTVALVAFTPFVAAAAPASLAGRPVLWSVHLDVNRVRSGVGLELFTNGDADLIPRLIATAEKKHGGLGGTLETVAMYGFQPPKNARRDGPFLANFVFSPTGGNISERFEAIRERRGLPVETVAGYPALHFEHEGKEVLVAKVGDYQVVVGTSRELLEAALKPETGGLASLSSPENARDLFGGSVELKDLPITDATLSKSELLKLLSHVEFHFDTDNKQLNLNVAAELPDERTAKRAARMIEGMTATLAMEDKTGVPWDERLVLGRDGTRLMMSVHLDPQEAKRLLDRAANEVKAAHEDR